MASILLTGAAGLLGGELAARLLARGHGVTALINRNKDVRGNDGAMLRSADWTGAAPRAGELLLLGGDLVRDGFGWDGGTHNALAAAHDLLIHCAAVTQFDAAPEVHRAVNVEGTRRAAALAAAGGMRLLHVSTAYVCGTRNGPIPEAPRDPAPFANGYEESKAAAEEVVRGSGVPAAIARPSIVVGEWASGRIRSFDTIYAAFRLIAEGRVRAMPASPRATLDFVPIDHVVAGLVVMAENMDGAAGRTVHLASGAPVPVATFRDAIAAVPHFHVPELVAPAAFDPARLSPLERRLHGRITGLYASYFQRDPRFVVAALPALGGPACPPTDAAFLARLIGYGIAAGFLPLTKRER